MRLQGIKSSFAFTRNPIVVRGDDGVTGSGRVSRYFVKVGDDIVFEGRATSPLYINFADIADAFIDFFPEADFGESGIIAQVADADDLRDREISIYTETFVDGDQSDQISVTALKGGVSRQNFRRLCEIGIDIFAARFCDYSKNVFFTARSDKWRFCIPEAELAPLYFLVDEGCSIEVRELTTGTYFMEDIDAGIWAINLDRLRRSFFEHGHVLPSAFDISLKQQDTCRIIITASEPVKDFFTLKFRNSYGFYELIRIEGAPKLSSSASGSGDDDNSFSRYDDITDSLTGDRNRMMMKRELSAETIVNSPERMRLILEMIMSEDVQLLFPDALPIKVLPSADELSYPCHPESPQRISLKFQLCEDELALLPPVVSGNESGKPRIHSDQFTQQFN